jgi:hypothetical protein
MKASGVTILAGLAAVVIASTASAQTNIIRITGAQADRGALNAAIGHILNPGYVYGYTGSSLSSANQVEFRGTTTVGSYPVDIKTDLIGSTGGLQELVDNLTLTGYFNATNLTTGGTSGLVGPFDSPEQSDVSISDSFQGSTLYTSPLVSDQVIGVTPYEWIKNAGSPSTISNITPLLAQALLGAGQIPLSQITGNSNDVNTIVTAVGRDENAGVRLVEFAESGFGIFTPPFQYEPIISGTPGPGGTITSIIAWPSNTVNGVNYPVGHSGYSTGSALAAALNTPGSSNATGGWLIGALAINDAASLTNNTGAGPLTWNGIAYSPEAVQQGQYTFWAYTHLDYRTSYSGTPQTIANQIGTQILNVDAANGGILLDTLQVGRTVEGGVVTYGNPY